MKTIEEFKQMGNPRRNGLGFIWLMESPRVRWNFYHPELIPAEVDQYHNHQHDFKSTIMKGRFCNRRAHLIEGDKSIWGIDCVANNKDSHESVIREEGVGLKLETTDRYITGDTYYMDAHEYHIAWAEAPTITRLERINNTVIEGLAVYDKDDKHLCPIKDFRLPHNMCWDIIEAVVSA